MRWITYRQDREKRRLLASWHAGLVYAGGVLVFCSLLLVLSGCTSIFFTPSKSGTPTTGDVTPTPTVAVAVTPTPTATLPPITLSVTGCPSTLSVNWDSLVGTKTGVSKVQKVACGSLEGAGSLDALISVRYYTSDAKLDVYVYDNLSGTPIQRFAARGLLGGDALISSSGTLMTAEIGPDSISTDARNLFKEYRWNGSTFTQLLFPGFFPDMTHYQAEMNQALVTAEVAAGQNHDAWRTSAFPVVDRLAQSIFHWSQITTKVGTYSDKTATYIINVYNAGPGGGGFAATLFRLDGVTTNIFEVRQVASIDGTVSLNSPANGAQISSPATVSGSSVATHNILGQVVLYDDTYILVGNSGPINSPTPSGSAAFTLSVSYHLNARGVQEGAIAFYYTNQNNVALSNQVVMVKVFFSA